MLWHPTPMVLLSLPRQATRLTWPRALWIPVERWGGIKSRLLTTWDCPPRLSLSRASTVCCCPCCSASWIWRSASSSSVPRREMLILHAHDTVGAVRPARDHACQGSGACARLAALARPTLHKVEARQRRWSLHERAQCGGGMRTRRHLSLLVVQGVFVSS